MANSNITKNDIELCLIFNASRNGIVYGIKSNFQIVIPSNICFDCNHFNLWYSILL